MGVARAHRAGAGRRESDAGAALPPPSLTRAVREERPRLAVRGGRRCGRGVGTLLAPEPCPQPGERALRLPKMLPSVLPSSAQIQARAGGRRLWWLLGHTALPRRELRPPVCYIQTYPRSTSLSQRSLLHKLHDALSKPSLYTFFTGGGWS